MSKQVKAVTSTLSILTPPAKSKTPRAKIVRTSSMIAHQKTHKFGYLKDQQLLGQMPLSPERGSLSSAQLTMKKIYEEIENTIFLNDAAPEVQVVLRKHLVAIKNSYKLFHTHAAQFFTTPINKRALPAAKVTLEKFIENWKPFVEQIEVYAKTRPPPHLQEITAKFHNLSLSLESIFQSNAERKHPSLAISKTVQSIQSVSTTLHENIKTLISQENFPNFETDLSSMFVNDISQLTKIVNKAFKNDFLQCGLTTAELQRLKSTIIAAIGIITSCVKASFNFYEAAETIQKFINRFNKETENIFKILNSPYTYFIEQKGEKIVYDDTSSDEEPKDEIMAALKEFVGADSNDYKMTSNEMKLRMFLKAVLPMFDDEYSDMDNPWDKLLYVEKRMTTIGDHLKSLNAQINESKQRAEKAEAALSEGSYIIRQREYMLSNYTKETDEKIKKITEANASLSKARDTLEAEIKEKMNIIEDLRSQKDAAFVRAGLKKAYRMLSDMAEKETNELGDFDLVNSISSLIDFIQKKFESERNNLWERLGSLKAEKTDEINKLNSENKELKEKLAAKELIIDKNKSEATIEEEDNFSDTPLITEAKSVIDPSHHTKSASISDMKEDKKPIEVPRSHSVSQVNSGQKEREKDDRPKMSFAQAERRPDSFLQISIERDLSEKYLKLFKGVAEELDLMLDEARAEEADGSPETLARIIKEQLDEVTKNFEEMHSHIESGNKEIGKLSDCLVGIYRELFGEKRTTASKMRKEIVDEIERLRELHRPLNEIIEKKEKELSELRQDVKDIKGRITAIALSSLSGSKAPSDAMEKKESEDVFEAIERIQDQERVYNARTAEAMAKLERARGCIANLVVRMANAGADCADGDVGSMGDEALMAAAERGLDAVLSPAFSEAFVSVDAINEVTAPLRGSSADPRDYLPRLVSDAAQLAQSFSLLGPTEECINDLIAGFQKFDIAKRDCEEFRRLKEGVSELNANVRALAEKSFVKTFPNILTRFLVFLQLIVF